MPVYRLGERLVFPPPEGADENGLVAIGGDLSPERLLLAYAQGIFPWPHGGESRLWFSPDPRFVLPLGAVHLPRSLRKRMRKEPWEIRFDTAFDPVMRACGAAPRPRQRGTWITRDLLSAYGRLHALGFAHSVEAYEGDTLVGGLYGVSLGRMFAGESMFAHREDASKVAFAVLLAHLAEWGFAFVDCQVHTEHLERFGALEVSRTQYLAALRRAVAFPTREGRWGVSMQSRAAEAQLRETQTELSR